MIRLAVLASALALALVTAGCHPGQDVSLAISDLSSPQAAQAAATIKQYASGVACATSAASLVAAGVEKGLAQNLVAADQTVYVSSAAACAFLGGTLTSSVPVTAAKVVSVGGQ